MKFLLLAKMFGPTTDKSCNQLSGGSGKSSMNAAGVASL
jgi:hypothetical protein